MAAASTTYVGLDEIPRTIRSELLKYDDSKNDGTEEYRYTDLPPTKKRIRLLRLYPGVLRSPQVLCEMFEAEFVEGEDLPRIASPIDSETLTKTVSYEALSWRWGDEDNSEYTIMIRDGDTMYRKRVSQTLGLALKYLRGGKDRILWIDAICINQKNKEERSYQVSMMSLVYTRAEQVCVWLGEDDENSRKAIQFIREDIGHLKNFDQLCTEDVHAPKWRAFIGLMQRDWFSRRWVVQEIALAPVASVYCGPDELEWRELAIAVELFVEVETATHRLSELLRRDAKSRLVPSWFEHISELGASLLVNATARIFREYQRSDETVKAPERRSLLSLEFLVTSLSIFDCGRPHDSVYALIAIARDASPNPPTSTKQKRHQVLIAQVFGDQLEQKPYLLDYNSPYPDVCKEFVQFCIERCAKLDPLQALDVLCRPWAKDWRPGTFHANEDDKPSPTKVGIWPSKHDDVNHDKQQVSWSEDACELFSNVSEVIPLNNEYNLSGSFAQHTEPTSHVAEDLMLGHPDEATLNENKIPLPKEFADEQNNAGASGDEGKPNSRSTLENDAWAPAWEKYKAGRRPQDGSSMPLDTVIIRPKTHTDKRNMDQYFQQCGYLTNDAAVDDFVSLAFPKTYPKSPVSSCQSTAPRHNNHNDAETDKLEEYKIAIGTLSEDPKLTDILRVKAKLAAYEIEKADREKGNKKPVAGSRSPKPTAKVEIPKHSRIQELGLPSWVARIDGAPFDIFPHPGMDMMKMGRRNADPLVGTPQDGHRNYSAGQTKVVDLKTLQFKRRAHLGHHSLYLKGFCFDRVAKVAQVSQAGAIPASWLDLAGWGEARRPTGMHGDLNDPPTAFWRTLVADRGGNDRNPPYYYARACKETILKGGIRSNAVDTTALIYNERNSIIAEFCRRVQAVIWNRALIRTAKGALGLVSEQVKEGDLICIVYGCTVPVILRRETANFKTKNECDNERLEDGIETMKHLMIKVERYRDRAYQYSKRPEEEKKEVKDYTRKHNKKHAQTKSANKIKEDNEIIDEREKLLGSRDSQSDIEEEDSMSDVEEEGKPARQGEHDKTLARQIKRQRKAKIRDPLRHYRFLDQAYIHGMMDGEAVRQKFYTGKPDHVFEIR
ncbi:hypothetical protein HBI16_075560 [Parastagonospora nodorum]|nr:hypothetical protein HBI48_007670 [Parastagonospora nodorum]KAH5777321.1 hypothetical protein HBI16_075560 [Parastagonospora nodorum]KAH5984638.1 hypothetical protein HBI84_232540 [Parastagonospora nodorum]KAH6045664.1 hypothetical protein HBI54_088320 [Parastagonospora nodorum]